MFFAKFKHFGILAIFCCVTLFAQVADAATSKRGRSFINPYPRHVRFNDGGDPGEPLFLTPLIEDPSMDNKVVQLKAKVPEDQFLNVTSYAGYLTVNKNWNSNLFFWYFPAENQMEAAPTVLWLQGGPGASSMFGLFAEHGPFELNAQGQLQKRVYSWSRTHNLIYIDNPVGTGFSFTDNDKGYARNEKDVGHDLHEAMQQLYELFNWNETAGFWITGESYGGKYVPALAYHIHRMQNAIDTRVHIPLKGVAIGNGLSDPQHQLDYAHYLYQIGLLDEHGEQTFEVEQRRGIQCIKQRNFSCAFEVFDELINGDMSNGSIFHNLTGFDFYYNYLKTKDDFNSKALGEFLQSTDIRRAIHVGNKTFHDTDGENKVEHFLKEDVMDSVAPWVAELLDYYTVCLYNGQLDIIVAYPLTRNYLNRLKFRARDVYKNAKRYPWKVDDEVAGYVKHAGNLIEIMVRNSGHMVPADQPKWMYDLINRLTHYKKVV